MRLKLTLHGELSEGGVKYVAQRYAMELHLTGISKRGPEGTIVIEVQGSKEKIDRYINRLKQGNQFFTVDKVDTEEMSEVQEKMFRIG